MPGHMCRCGEIGRHEGLKIPFWRQSTGSTPVGGIRKLTIVRCCVGSWAFSLLRTRLELGEGARLPERDFSHKMEESLSMKKRNFRTNSVPRPTIRAAFEQFQRQNTIKNLSQGTIEFYSAKSKCFFTFLGDTEQCIDPITEEDVEDYILMQPEQGREVSFSWCFPFCFWA